MATPRTKEPETPAPGTALTPPVNGGAPALPSFMEEQVKRDAGKGVSTDASDNLVPLIYLLQTNSPQVNSRHESYIDGAKPGDIWLRSSSNPIVPGETGFIFQSCHFAKCWVEWMPERGGFVARHPDKPAQAALKKITNDKGDQVDAWVMPNGNIVNETREHSGFVLGRGAPQPYTLPFTSTGHTVSREWMMRMNQKVLPDGKTKAPSWACLYRLTTKFKKNKKGEWFVFAVDDAESGKDTWVQTPDDYRRGAALHEAFASGTKQTAAPEGSSETTSDGKGDDDIPF